MGIMQRTQTVDRYVHLSLRTLHSLSGREACEQAIALIFAINQPIGVGVNLGLGLKGKPKIGGGDIRANKVVRRNPDNCKAESVQINHPAQDCRIFSEPFLPAVFTDDCWECGKSVCIEPSAPHRLHAEYAEVVARDGKSSYKNGLFAFGSERLRKTQLFGAESDHATERANRVAISLIIGIAESEPRRAGLA